MQLREYQETAVKKLKDTANELLNLHGNKSIVFEAPTGSGKTVMMAEFLKQFVVNRTDGKQFSFLWTAPRKLHTQSKIKLGKYYEDSHALVCLDFDDLMDQMIGENEILFLNWESINKADNIYIRDNERDHNLSHIIQNTLDNGLIIILIIDESHFAADSEISQGLIKMFNPKITVEVSATPHMRASEKVKVYREKVIAEGMIKKQISINPGFKNLIKEMKLGEVEIKSQASESTNEFVIKAALEKRQSLAKEFQEIGSNVNPLMLIQLPDRRKGTDDIKDEIIEILKDNHNITVENGKLAIYLSGDENKENLENITRNDSETEVMIFKQAIALGWDCPRASILVLFRDWKSITFSIQTVGRILRMPELKHYEKEELNTGFVFTNLADISIQEELAGNYMTVYNSQRIERYKNLELLSVHSKRHREETRLSPKYIKCFLDAAKELKLKENIDTDVQKIEAKLISDGVITDPDKEFEHIQEKQLSIDDTHGSKFVERVQNETEIQKLFNLFVIDALAPLAPESRSVDKIKTGIYNFFKYEFPMQFEYNGVKAQMIVLSEQNNQKFINVINRAKELYFADIELGKKSLEKDEKWEVPQSINYGSNYSEKEFKLSVMQPYFESNSASQVEKEFAMFLDKKENEIEWWFKNGERDGTFFAVPYKENDEKKPFYVDWIVKYKDGRIGLFDTKGGITAETAKTRAEGLSKYIREQNTKNKKLFGGIVIYKDGSWRYNDNEVYEYNERDLKDWKFLN